MVEADKRMRDDGVLINGAPLDGGMNYVGFHGRGRHVPATWPYPRHPNGPNDPLFGGHPYFERHIYLYRSQLMFDIESEIGVMARVRRGMTQSADMGSDDSLNSIVDNYRPLLSRWIDKYVNLAKGRMAAMILEPHKQSGSNALKDAEEIDIELQVPDFWDDTCFQPLVQSVHDYVVNGAVYELLLLMLPPKENIVNVKGNDVEMSYGDIKRYVCAVKPGWVKKPLQPF